MVNKKELVLLLSLSFCIGVIFSDFTKPKSVVAETTNIVYDTLNAKIEKLSGSFDSLNLRVRTLETADDKYTAKIESLAKTVKELASVQKTALNDMANMASAKDLKKLETQVGKLEQAVKALNAIQKIQQTSN